MWAPVLAERQEKVKREKWRHLLGPRVPIFLMMFDKVVDDCKSPHRASFQSICSHPGFWLPVEGAGGIVLWHDGARLAASLCLRVSELGQVTAGLELFNFTHTWQYQSFDHILSNKTATFPVSFSYTLIQACRISRLLELKNTFN